MNWLGKILTLVILVMSIGFMFASFFVYATHRNWKQEAEKTRVELQQAQTRNRELEASITERRTLLEAERAARTTALASLEQRAQAAQQALTDANRTLAELRQQERQALQAVAGAQETLTNLNREVADLRGAVRKAEDDRDQMFQQVVDLKVKEQQAEAVRRRLEAQNQGLVQQFSRANAVLRSRGLNAESPLTNVPPPLEGEVVAVDNNSGFVTISLGADEGLQRNHTLDVSRRGQYLGRIEVIKTESDQSVGKILDGFRKGAIMRGDSVQTKNW